MIEFRNYQSINPRGKSVKLTIASGPVIIEGNKVLLDKHGEDNFWKFPGGAQAENRSTRENAIKEVKRELGVVVKLSGDPFVLVLERKKEGMKEYVVLVHYWARRVNKNIKPAKYVREYGWHKVDNLPRDCAANIKPVVKYFAKKV